MAKNLGKAEEGGDLALTSDRLSAYDFYQYLIRFPDADVIKMLRMLTFVEMQEIHEIEKSMQQKDYVPNAAQKRLAEEITRLIHGEEGLKTALKITQEAAPGAKTALDSQTLKALAQQLPTKMVDVKEIVGSKLVDLLCSTDVQSSKAEARRLIANGGVYLNNEQISDENFVVKKEDLIDGRLLLVGIGKKRKVVIQVNE